MTRLRTYQELRRIDTFEERFHYLSLRGQVGESTFGFDRWINQRFYNSKQWKDVRNEVLVRDMGCDLGIEGYEIHQSPYIHHMNPMTPQNLINDDEAVLDLNQLITVSHRTHNAIHYGDESQLPRAFTPRRKGDTKLW